MGYQSRSSLGCRQAFDLEVDWPVENEREDAHSLEPVCQAGGQHGPVEKKLDWYDRLRGVPTFDFNEDQEGDEGQG